MAVPARGYRHRGGGRAVYVQAAGEWRATSVQACGLWPFAAGTGSPMVGVPVGRNIISGATLCADPISWFQRAKLIGNPSMWVQGLPGLGKSALVKRIALGLAGYGVMPLVLGDLKPDYVPLVRALDGQVITVGRGRGSVNVLDPGEAAAAAARLTGQARAQLVADSRGRRQTILSALVTVVRGRAPEDHEDELLGRALAILDDRHQGVPVLRDLIALVDQAPEDLRELTRDRGDLDRYRDATDELVKSLTALLGRGRLGGVFAEQTTTPMRRDRAVCFDLSSIDDGDTDLQRAALLACWATGFGSIAVANALADAGLEPQRTVLAIMDELWRALRGGRGMVDKIDALTRLNRQRGIGQIMVSHTMRDLEALADDDDRAKARGFVERAGMLALGGLPAAEMPLLTSAVGLTRAEQNLVIGWQDPPAWDAEHDEHTAPPGRGNFLLKVGSRPGIPVHVTLTDAELSITDTDHRWRTAA